MNRRTFLKNIMKSIISLTAISGAGYYYAHKIEPNMLHVNKQTIVFNNIPKSFNDFKIIQFSDTHIDFHYTIQQLTELIQKINSLKPDLITFTGDLIDKPQHFLQTAALIDALSSLEATYGKYWIYGNHDHGGYGTSLVQEVMEQANFKLLKNEHEPIIIHGEEIIISGVDDVMLGQPDLEKTLQGVDPELFTILLVHEPDFANIASNYPVDVQLSGHSHGGQIRLPFIGHLYTPTFAKQYVDGKYELNEKNLTLFVNKGIGTTRLPVRLFCKPEIHLYTLQQG